MTDRMYARILVALDGSPLAERVRPHVEALAERFGATVTLLRATDPLAGGAAAGLPLEGGAYDPTPLVEADRREAAAYLEGVASRLRARGLAVEQAQPDGEAPGAIAQHARRWGADLVAMTTHGRSGLERVVFGSVAEAVLRRAPCPVLLVRVGEAAEDTPQA